MNKTLSVILQMKAAVSGNTLLYYLKRIWLIRDVLPDSLYGDSSLKNIVSAVATGLLEFTKFIRKGIYLAVIFVPILMAGGNESLREPGSLPMFVHILFCLSCISGPLLDSEIFTVTRQKFICLKYMKMNAGRYVRCSFLLRYTLHFLYFLPFLLGSILLLGGTLWQGLQLWLVMICFRFLGEAIQLALFDKTGIIFYRKTGLVWCLIAVALVAAYVPAFTKTAMPTMELLFSIPATVLLWLVGAASFYYCMWGYKQYSRRIPHTLDTKFLFSEAAKQSKQAAFRDVQMKESDLDQTTARRSLKTGLKGYAYFNALFFARHRRLLFRPVLIRLAIAAAVFVILAAARFIAPEQVAPLGQNLSLLLPMLLFVMYFMSTAEKSCRAMFYNCDISLLRYGFYRKREVILKNFGIRLRYIAGYNLIVSAAVSVGALLFTALCGGEVLRLENLMFVVAILLLSVFFTVHHLFLYYVFQPYTTELDVKNPFFKAINMAVYMVCFLGMRLKSGSTAFTLGVLVLTLLYISAALFCVYRFAPKTFRVK